jgi:hypothetical protein
METKPGLGHMKRIDEMLKKLTLLAMAVGALIAFAVPATASALTWDTNGVPIGNEENADKVHFTGTLSSTKGGLKISCDATANVNLWNNNGAHGLVTELLLTPHPTTTVGCTVAVFVSIPVGYMDITNCHVNATANGTPWTVTTSGTNSVTIDGANFTNEFVGTGCAEHLKIPSGTKVSDKGNAEGEVVGECIVFNNSGTFEGGSLIDGELCPTEPGLELTS